MVTVEGFLSQRVDALLDAIASDAPAPGGGAVAALVVAMAAGLVAMAARFSGEAWPEAAAVVERADDLRARVAPLAPADAQAYGDVLAAMRLPKDESDARKTAISAALARAADVPLAVAKEASEVAALGALTAERGNPNLRGDAVAGALLAASGARAAANLVEINVGGADDARVERAREHAAAAADAAARALSPGAGNGATRA